MGIDLKLQDMTIYASGKKESILLFLEIFNRKHVPLLVRHRLSFITIKSTKAAF